jgi:hypothetical protein
MLAASELNDMFSQLGLLIAVLFEKSVVIQLFKKFPTIFGTRSFITIITRACHCPCVEPVYSSAHTHTTFL